MNQNLKVKIRVKGKCMIISIRQQQPVESILRLLHENRTISQFISWKDLDIKNNWSRVILTPDMKIGELSVNQKSGLREIQVRNKQQLVYDFQSTLYDPQSQKFFKQACENLLNNDQNGLNQLRMERKISNNLFQLMMRVKDRMKNNQDTVKQIQRQKQQSEKLNKLLQQNRENQNKIANTIKHIETLQQYIKKLQVSDKITKISSEPKLSEDSIKALNQMYQKIEKKLQSIGTQSEKKIQEARQAFERQMRSSIKVNNYSLLYKSKTFEIEAFQPRLQEYSQKLKEFIQDYTKNQIKQFQQILFVNGSNPTAFIQQATGKENVILLFSSGQNLFGIFTRAPFGAKPNSKDGFLFCITTGQAYLLKPNKPIWKKSTIDIKIGNDSLVMAEPTKKGVQLKMKHKTSLQESFEIEQGEANRLFGQVGNQINITSFQMLSVIFLHESKVQNQSLFMSISTKAEESV